MWSHWDWWITWNAWIISFYIFVDVVIDKTMNYSWQSYFVQITHVVEYINHVYIIFQIQKKSNYLSLLHKLECGNTINTTWGAIETTLSSTITMGIMSTITRKITWNSTSISTIFSHWVKRITLFICQGHLTQLRTTKLRGILTIDITSNWYMIWIDS